MVKKKSVWYRRDGIKDENIKVNEIDEIKMVFDNYENKKCIISMKQISRSMKSRKYEGVEISNLNLMLINGVYKWTNTF